MIPFRAGFANRGEDSGWGIALTQPVDVTGTTSGTAVNNGVASDDGGLACLHVLEAAGGDAYAITIEGSATATLKPATGAAPEWGAV